MRQKHRERLNDVDNEEVIARMLTESTYRLYRMVEEKAPEWGDMTGDGRDSWYRMVCWYVSQLEALSGQTFADVAAKLCEKFAPGVMFSALSARQQMVWQAIARYVATCCNDMPENMEYEEGRWLVWIDQRAPKPVVIENAPVEAV